MPEPYAVSINQKTGKREEYWTKKDYEEARLQKSATANATRKRIEDKVPGNERNRYLGKAS